MATLKAPLFSFGASGKLADSLVFLPWKGLNNVRKYVIPTNPNTAAQITQRITNFKAGVTKWHTFTCSALDLAAWALYASTCISKVHASYVGVMSGFNAFMRAFVDIIIAAPAMVWNELSHVTITTAAGPNIVVHCGKGLIADDPYVYCGTTKTYMPTAVIRDVGSLDNAINWTLAALLPSTKYYFWIKATAGGCGARTGIYTQISPAA